MLIKTAILILITQFICLKCFMYHRDNDCNVEEETLTVEFYKKDDSLFILVSERVAWFEAASICKYYEANLCMPNSTAKAEFVAYFLAESNFRFEDFWLGARYIKEEWMWMDGQFVRSSEIPGPWREYAKGKECLVIERSKHYTPMFAALSCYLPKPFICERAISARTSKPLPSLPAQTVRIDDSIFTFYHSRISWAEALAFCRTVGQRLAVIPNQKVVKILRTEILRTRPNIENAWIGAYYYQNSWIWAPTGIKIPHKKQEGDDYPPWFKGDAGIYTEGCVLFDRHFIYAYFLPARCQKRKDFICEQYVHSPNPVEIDNSTISCTYESTVMYIYLIDKNWTEAQTFCKNNDTVLAEPSNYDTVKAIAVCLGDHPAEPKHVWLGGKYVKDQWLWVNSHKEIGNYLPWCEEESEKNSACLNLDRTDHDKPWVYGLQCRKKQPFVCVESEDKIDTTTGKPTTPNVCVCPCEQPSIPMQYNNNTFIAFMFSVKAGSIFKYCQYFGGVPFTTKLSKETQNYVLSYIRLSIEPCGCCTDDMVDFWVNGNDDHLCTAINLGSNKIVQNKDCNTRRPFICQTFCTETPTSSIHTNENATINCEWMKVSGKLPYKSCKFSCGYGYTLFGPDRFTCDHYGWKIHAVENITQLRFPECHKTEDTARELINVLSEIKPDGLYFAIKENQKMGRTAWIAILQFVISIIQVFPNSEEFYFGLLTFSSRVNIRIPYDDTSSCMVLQTLRNMNISKGAEKTYYDLALSEIDNELQRKLPLNKKTLIVFVVDKENAGAEYDIFVKRIHSNNKIFVVGITDEKFIFDLDMVASIGLMYRLYTMKVRDYNALTNISIKLLEYRSPKIDCSKYLYILPGLTSEVEDLKELSKLDIDIVQQDITYYIIKNFVPYKEANDQCRTKYGGKLINDYIAHKLFIETNMKQFQIEYFWIQQSSQCIVAEVHTQEFAGRNCHTRHPFVCAVDCSFLPPINDNDNLENIVDEPHSFDCYNNDEVLWGPPDLRCDKTKGGWITSGYRRSPFPKCLSAPNFIEKMLETLSIKRNKYQAGILFVLDESKSVANEHFQIQLKFVETIVKLYPASKSLPYGLITFSKEAKLKIPYQAEDSCKFVKDLASIKLNTLGDTTDYVAAIQLVDKQIGEYREQQFTAVYFITNGLFVGELMDVKHAVGTLLRWKVELFVLKVGQFDSEVTLEIPTRDNQYNFNLFNIPSYSAFSNLTDILLKESKRLPLICKYV